MRQMTDEKEPGTASSLGDKQKLKQKGPVNTQGCLDLSYEL